MTSCAPACVVVVCCGGLMKCGAIGYGWHLGFGSPDVALQRLLMLMPSSTTLLIR